MVGGWLRLLPEILGQPTPVAALATGSATTAKKLRGGGRFGSQHRDAWSLRLLRLC